MVENPGLLRIGELARRAGVSPTLLRAWESRYGLVRPERTASGYRLYSEADVERVRRMREQMARGLAAAEAAQVVLASWPNPPSEQDAARMCDELLTAVLAYDELHAQGILDRVLASLSFESSLLDVLLPVLREVGARWARGEASIAQEHFASEIVRGRLATLARGWDAGSGPAALVACAPDDQHDIGLLAFALALRRHGWRITYLGRDTPLPALGEAAGLLCPHRTIVAATMPLPAARETELHALARTTRLALAGPTTDDETADRLAVPLLLGDPVSAARTIADQQRAEVS